MSKLIPFNRRNLLDDSFNGFSNALDNFFTDDFFSRNNFTNISFPLDIQETEEEYLLEAEIPGVEKDEIELSYKDNTLNISIKKEKTSDESNKNYVHRERCLTSMERSINLRDVDEKEIKAKLDNGLLTIHLPKKYKEDNQNFKIEIQ